jgi:hypothetical protein
MRVGRKQLAGAPAARQAPIAPYSAALRLILAALLSSTGFK